MAAQSITVKFQHQGRFRRFTLDVNDDAYANLKSAILQISNSALPVEVAWRDADGDEILIGSQMELLDAIKNRQGDVLRLYTLGEEPTSVASTPVADAPRMVLWNAAQLNKPAPVNVEAPKEEAKKEPIHASVICDGCRANPVVGARYKCLTCKDYDLCQTCADKNVHSEHSLIKISSPNDCSWREAFFWSQRNQRFGNGGSRRWHHPRHPFWHPMMNAPGRRCGPGAWAPQADPSAPNSEQQATDAEKMAQEKATYNEAFKTVFEDVSKLINENKHVLQGSGEYLRQIGLAAAEALSQLGIDADIEIETNGERENMNKKEEEKKAEKKDEKKDEEKKEEDKQATAPAEPIDETPVVRETTPEVDILEGGNWQYVTAVPNNQPKLYPGLSNPSTSNAEDSAESVCLSQLMAMGFANDGGWLEAIVKAKKGDLNQVLNALQRKA